MPTIDFELACVDCKASLRGCFLGQSCPACHSPIARTVDLKLVDTETLALVTDVACRGCGYNLRTLPLEAACPECATPVANSARPDELRLADPGWLRAMSTGVTLLLLAGVGYPVLAVIAALAAFAGGAVQMIF